MEINPKFEADIQNPVIPIAIDFDVERNVLLIAFSGMAGMLGIPIFEFNKITSAFEKTNKVYLRDVRQSWYHRGLPNAGDNIDGIAAFLRQYTERQSTHRTIIFGNSGGAYAALLFGHLLQADEVHAFSPKTLVDPIKRLALCDLPPGIYKWRLWQLLLHGQRKYFDLKKVFLAAPKAGKNIHIYYSAQYKSDYYHAIRMESIPGIHLHSYPYDHHALIQQLKKSEELRQIIERAIQ